MKALTPEQFTLSFCTSATGGIELARTEFRMRHGPAVAAVRRAAAAIKDDFGSFIWSAGVRGLSLLCVGTAATHAAGRGSPYILSGGGRSVAAALDRALNKPADWISEVFGAISPRALFRRENSERKRSGPVRISLAATLQRPGAIAIFLNGTRCDSASELGALLAKLGAADGTSNPAALRAELLVAIEAVSTEQLLQGGGSLVRARREPLTEARVRSFTAKDLKIFSVPSAIAANAALHESAHTAGCRADWSFHSATTELIEPARRSAQTGTPVWLVLSRGAAAQLTRSPAGKFFRRCFLLPQSSFDLIAPPGGSTVSEVLVSGATTGYPQRYLRFLRSLQHPRLSSALHVRVTPLTRVIAELRQRPGAGLIVAAPYSLMVCQALGLSFFHTKVPTPHFSAADNILFVSNLGTHENLAAHLRRSWITLISAKEEHSRVIRSIYSSTRLAQFAKVIQS